MKLLSVIRKSLVEQLRNFWILILTVSMGPFFISVYFLIVESSKPQYDILVITNDKGALVENKKINYGKELVTFFSRTLKDSTNIPFRLNEDTDRERAILKLKNKDADAVIILPENFSLSLLAASKKDTVTTSAVEFIGDLTNTNYLITAVWANEILNEFAAMFMNIKKPFYVKETSLGLSGSIDDFDMVIPGLLMLSLIMLMFTATIAFVTEVENKTIIRLKLSKLGSLTFLIGTSIIQLFLGLLSVFLSLAIAISLGFDYTQSGLWIFILLSLLTSISIVAFSLIIAALTKSANEVLVVGNFPLFLFMFFTGAAFPMHMEGLINVAGYDISVQGLMSPTHAIIALKKVLVMRMSIGDIIPEIISIIILSIIYFIIGLLLFYRRHLKIQ